MSIRLVDEFGPVLLGRSAGENVRLRARRAVERGEAVTLDFDGVEEISPSFADEVFAKLKEDIPPTATSRVRFENLGDDLRALAKLVVRNRES